MDRWARIVDHLLGEVIGDGDISGLPGAGKPLSLNEDSHTPPDQRAAFKIMRDNEVVPEWVTLAKTVDVSEAHIRAEIESKAVESTIDPRGAASGPARKGETWNSLYMDRLHERIESHNRQVLLHNLTAPSGIAHKPILVGDKLIQQALAKTSRDA